MTTPKRIKKYQEKVIKKQCKRCGTFFYQMRRLSGYCEKCILERKKELRPRTKLVCEVCNKEFYPIGGHLKQKTCSKKCGYKIRRVGGKKGKHYLNNQRAEVRICPICNKRFRATKDQNGKLGGKKIRKQRYCSHKCYMKSREETMPERLMREFLDKQKIKYKQEYRISSYWIDFYIPTKNLCIEVDGDYWHNLEKVKIRDRKKDNYLKSKGYNLMRIREKEILSKVIIRRFEKFTGQKAKKLN